LANSASDSTVSVLSEEVVPEQETATVIPMTVAATGPTTPPKMTPPVIPTTVPTTSPPPPSRLPVYEVLAAVLSARVLSLLLVLLDAGVAIVAILSPTPERLIGMSIVFAFSLASFWLIGRSEPARSVPKKD
jgi:hypothetical protein